MVIEPLVQGAVGHARHRPRRRGPRGRRLPGGPASCSSPTRWPPASAAPAGCSPPNGAGIRPDLLCLGKGLTGGYLPMSATVASGRRLRRVPRRGPRTAHLLPRALLRRERTGRGGGPRHLRLIDEWDVLANVTGARGAAGRACWPTSVAPLPTVADVRQRGLMVGVELAPPAGGRRWGRRVCAAGRGRGVLLRPLGDVVVLMPPLTITADEIDRIVATLVEALARGGRGHRPPDASRRGAGRHAGGATGGAVTVSSGPPRRASGSSRVEQANSQLQADGRWRRPVTFDARGPEGSLAPRDGRQVVSFASNDYLGPARSTRRWSPPPTRPSTAGAPGRAPAGWSPGVAPVHEDLEAGAGRLEGHRARRGASRPGSPPTSACSAPSAAPASASAPTSSTTRRSSTAARLAPGRGRRLPPRRRRPPRDAARARRPGPTIVVTDMVFSMDGDVAPVAAHRRRLPPPRRAARPRRGPRRPRPRPRPRARRRPTSSAWARCPRPSASLGGFVAGPAAVRRSPRQPGPLLHLHHRRPPRPTPPPPWPLSASWRHPRERRLRRPAGRPRRVGWPRPPQSRSSPSSSDPRSGRSPRRRPCSTGASGCRPSARRRCRRARPACGSPSRRPTPTTHVATGSVDALAGLAVSAVAVPHSVGRRTPSAPRSVSGIASGRSSSWWPAPAPTWARPGWGPGCLESWRAAAALGGGPQAGPVLRPAGSGPTDADVLGARQR